MNNETRLFWAGFGFLLGAGLGICAIAFVALFSAPARAAEIGAPDVQVMMGRVEAILVMNGYPDAAGFARTPTPRLEVVEALPNHDWGSYGADNRGWYVKISREQTPGCEPVTIAHELGHIATITNHLIPPDAPGDAASVRAQFQRIAALVEDHVSSDGVWLPGCLMRRGQF